MDGDQAGGGVAAGVELSPGRRAGPGPDAEPGCAEGRRGRFGATANTPDEINEMFDGIAYGKAGAVIGMVENYLGKEIFRQGVHNYLAAHLYGNATAEDFWNAQTANWHLPVDKIMSSFVAQPGVPLLTLRSGRRAEFRWRRAGSSCLMDANAGPAIAAMDRAGLPEDERRRRSAGCSRRRIAASRCRWMLGCRCSMSTRAAKGYYRTAYTPTQYSAIVAKAETALTPPEKIGLAGRPLGAGAVGAGKRGGLSRSGACAEGRTRTLRCSIRRINKWRRSTRRLQQTRIATAFARGGATAVWAGVCGAGESGEGRIVRPAAASRDICSRCWGTRGIPRCWPRRRL